jgi:PadR family transcriptional regulator PadR
MSNISNQEELVLLAVGSLFPEAYAYGIKKEIKEETGTGFSLGTIHTILYRMENEGLLTSEMGGSTSKRGGRSKRLYQLTYKGFGVVEALRKARQALWSKISTDQLQYTG